jgi:pyruvate, water dikinase
MEHILKIILLSIAYLIISTNSYSQAYLNKLTSKQDFDKLSGLPLSNKYGQVSAVKLVYDLQTEKLFFINSKYYKYHHEFCSDKLGYTTELSYFNRVNYSNTPKRRFLLANINYFKSIGTFALEISAVDQMNIGQIFRLFEIVSQAVYCGSNLKFLLNSSGLQTQQSIIEQKIPILRPADIYLNSDYQMISQHQAYGTLRFIKDLKKEQNTLSPLDIVVLNETPLVLPKVAGIIVSEFQTPLSHLTILGQNRKIPICAYKPVFQDSDLLNLNGQKISYQVLSDTFEIKPVDKLANKNVKPKSIRLKSDLNITELVDMKDLNRKSYAYAGNKASNFGILYKLSQKGGFKVPESAFVIPFYYYQEHIVRSSCQMLIDSLLKNPASDSVRSLLKSIRNKIKSTPIDTNLLDKVDNKIKSLGDFRRMRFRSSTNAEDAKGFSGAGLYTSKTGIADNPEKSVEQAIKKVWASLWSYGAFSEREYFNIDHRDVYMGILVHRSFPDEAVNGVAITKNLYRPDGYGFVVNARPGNESVVKPSAGAISDQFICYPNTAKDIYANKNTVEIITVSNREQNKLVMDDKEIQHLANQLDLIKKYFFAHSLSNKSYTEFGLDVEFKLDGTNRELYIKQIRLYND